MQDQTNKQSGNVRSEPIIHKLEYSDSFLIKTHVSLATNFWDSSNTTPKSLLIRNDPESQSPISDLGRRRGKSWESIFSKCFTLQVRFQLHRFHLYLLCPSLHTHWFSCHEIDMIFSVIIFDLIFLVLIFIMFTYLSAFKKNYLVCLLA